MFLYYIGAIIFSIALGFNNHSLVDVFLSIGSIIMVSEAFVGLVNYLNSGTKFQDVDRG